MGKSRRTNAVKETRVACFTCGSLVFFLFLFLVHNAHGFCFQEAATEAGVDSALLESIARTESRMDQRAIHRNANGSEDMGLMQINSYWIDKMGLDRNRLLSDACYNTKTGAQILKECVNRFGYNWEAVGCYNARTPEKKMNYSWKIFRSLKEPKATVAHPICISSHPSSFSFQSRDRFEAINK